MSLFKTTFVRSLSFITAVDILKPEGFVVLKTSLKNKKTGTLEIHSAGLLLWAGKLVLTQQIVGK